MIFASAKTSNVQTHQWTVLPQPRPDANVCLLCIPSAGVGPSSMRVWSGGFGTPVEVSLLELPGRDRSWRLSPFRRVTEIVGAAAQALQGLTARPYAVFGHSMGAVLAYELVRELRRLGAPLPRHVFVSAHRAPHLKSRLSSLDGLDDAAFLREVGERYGGVPEAVTREPELLALLLPRLRADFEALSTYDYQSGPPLDCPVTAFGGLDDATVNRAELEAWSQHTTGRFRVRLWPGGHFYLHTASREMIADMTADVTGRTQDVGEGRS